MTRWRIEIRSFVGSTFDRNIGEGSSDNTTDPIRSWINVIEPVAPENRDLRVRAHNTVKETEHDEEKG